jgi:hypothetical protein
MARVHGVVMMFKSRKSQGGMGKLVCPWLLLLLVGCTYDNDSAKNRPTTRPADAALKDPYGKWSTVDTDITGGGVSNLNRDALKRDVDNFWLK